MALQVPFKIFLNTASTAVIVEDNAGVLLKTVPRSQISIQNAGSLNRIRVFQNDTDTYLFTDILDEAGATYGATRDLAAKELSNLAGFNLGGGSGSVNSVTASAPLTSSGGANPNITLQNPGDGNWALNFSGGIANFIPIQGETVGSYKAFAHTNIPTNFLFCNGAIVLIATYPDLFAVIGNTYGGDGIVNFALPDLQNRFLKGDNGANIATSSGNNILTIPQLPMHTPTLNVSANTGGHGVIVAGDNLVSTAGGGNGIANIYNNDTTNTISLSGFNTIGGNQPHEHPHLVGRWAICFESVGISGAGTTPSLQQVSDIGFNSTNRLQFNTVDYALITDIVPTTPQGLQEVTDIGNITTNEVIVKQVDIFTGQIFESIVGPGYILAKDTTNGNLTFIASNGFQFTRNGTNTLILDVNPMTASRNQFYQDASGTIALVQDFAPVATAQFLNRSAFVPTTTLFTVLVAGIYEVRLISSVQSVGNTLISTQTLTHRELGIVKAVPCGNGVNCNNINNNSTVIKNVFCDAGTTISYTNQLVVGSPGNYNLRILINKIS